LPNLTCKAIFTKAVFGRQHRHLRKTLLTVRVLATVKRDLYMPSHRRSVLPRQEASHLASEHRHLRKRD
jgi:hypothetical protein